jgi:hypothetical protein
MTDERCPACGAAVRPGAWYCLACGAAHAAPRPPASAGGHRAAVLAALLAVAVVGAVAGAWIERQRSDPAAAPVTVPTVITETVTLPAPPPVVTTVAQRTTGTAALRAARGGHARASRE